MESHKNVFGKVTERTLGSLETSTMIPASGFPVTELRFDRRRYFGLDRGKTDVDADRPQVGVEWE